MTIDFHSHALIIDGSGYIYRAYHAYPKLSRSTDGFPTGAIYGFCQMLINLSRRDWCHPPPTHVVMVLDRPGKNWRHDIFDGYKAGRHRPDDLTRQLEHISYVTGAFNIVSSGQDGYEADDLIATYTRQVIERDGDVTIATQDKDMLQLIRPGVRIYEPRERKWLYEADAVAKFGVDPTLIVDVQGLMGDSVDRIPGVPKVGAKTAALLINEHGSLEAVLAAAPSMKKSVIRDNLIAFADQARMSKALAALNDNVATDVTIDQCPAGEPRLPELWAFCRELEFRSFFPLLESIFGLKGI